MQVARCSLMQYQSGKAAGILQSSVAEHRAVLSQKSSERAFSEGSTDAINNHADRRRCHWDREETHHGGSRAKNQIPKFYSTLHLAVLNRSYPHSNL